MKPTTNGLFASQSSSFPFPRFRGQLPTIFTANQKKKILPNLNVVTFLLSSDSDVFPSGIVASRRAILVAPPLLAAAASLFLRPSISSATTETSTESAAVPPPAASTAPPPPSVSVAKEESITSRIYDASVLGEPMAVGKDKKRVWEKLLNARIVYLGEAEQVPTRDDKVLELEIVRNLKKRCIESDLQLSLALEAFPLDLQDQLNQYMDNRMDGEALKSFVSHWPAQRWEEYEPLLSYCRDNAIKLIACGTPLKILRTVQAIVPFGPSSYLSAQARVVEDHTMSQVIIQAVADGGGTGLLLVVTGANHVEYGSRGTGVPARISRKIRKKSQLVVLLDPERLGRYIQSSRKAQAN